MFKYILKRIIIFLPTLIIISLLAFVISVNAPGDPVERMVVAAQSGGEIGSQTVSQVEQKKFWRKKLGLDLPVFYVAIRSLSEPDTLYRVFDKNDRGSLSRLTSKYGNWELISDYYNSINKLDNEFLKTRFDSTNLSNYTVDDARQSINEARFETISLKSTYDDNIINAKIEKLKGLFNRFTFLHHLRDDLTEVETNYNEVKSNPESWKNYIPKLSFYSLNQYHRWVFGDGHWITGKDAVYSRGIVRGDFGTSYVTKQPISEVIGEKIGWSLFFSLASVFLAYLVSIPLGIKAAAEKDSKFDRISSVGLFILFSLPSFWVATLLLMIFANPDVFHAFPASGVKPATGYPVGASLWEKMEISLPFIILPLICYTYSSFAFLSRTMRVSMLEVIGQDYIRTARAKGLPKSKVIYKHALRNSLLPIITIFANIFPLAIGGSVILETIFTIPGMGYEIFFAIQNNNYPMIIAVFTITGVLTLVGYLVSDILYAVVDPRISYSK
ncbi:MAG: ABC transporter permease subunit [Bacteroidia bacterium]